MVFDEVIFDDVSDTRNIDSWKISLTSTFFSALNEPYTQKTQIPVQIFTL